MVLKILKLGQVSGEASGVVSEGAGRVDTLTSEPNFTRSPKTASSSLS